MSSKELKRCAWANPKNRLYLDYHDNEWGVPIHDDRLLFELLILEGAQAGLSWETILNRRAGYKAAFDDFDLEKVANYSDKKLEALKQDERIIRNKLKIESARKNAKAFIEIQKEFGSFASYFWAYVDGQPIVNNWKSLKEVPAKTELSDEISKDLKKRGMSFVGSTIIYAYMQSAGLVNDHVMDCFCRASST